MNKVLVILLYLMLLFAQKTRAQGWQWAVSSMGDFDEYGVSVNTDHAGNVYVAGVFRTPIVTFGIYSLFT